MAYLAADRVPAAPQATAHPIVHLMKFSGVPRPRGDNRGGRRGEDRRPPRRRRRPGPLPAHPDLPAQPADRRARPARRGGHRARPGPPLLPRHPHPQVESALAAEADEKNRHVIIAIDEAHLLSHDQLEVIRMLTNSGIDYRSPAIIVLIGQPTLRRRLRVGDMAALDQRIQLRYHYPAPALTAAEAAGYLRAHLTLAGRTDTLFSDDAARAIHAHARGMPRAINRLAITALLAAYTTGKTIVDESSARTAITEDTATD